MLVINYLNGLAVFTYDLSDLEMEPKEGEKFLVAIELTMFCCLE